MQPSEQLPIRRHGTAVALRGEAVLLLGESGSGKSELAARLIADGAVLIADDQVHLTYANEQGHERIIVSSPPNIAGVLELHGVGLIRVPHVHSAPLRLVIRCETGPLERLPERRKWVCEGVPIEEFSLDARAPGTPAKCRLLVEAMQSGNFLPERWSVYEVPDFLRPIGNAS